LVGLTLALAVLPAGLMLFLGATLQLRRGRTVAESNPVTEWEDKWLPVARWVGLGLTLLGGLGLMSLFAG